MSDIESGSRARRERSSAEKQESPPFTIGKLGELSGFAVRRLSQHLGSASADVTLTEGLRPHQFTALSLIVDNPLMSQNELARALGIKPSNIVPLIDEMESRGLALRKKADTNRRTYALIATAAGKRLRNRIFSLIMRKEEETLSALSNDERASLTTIARKLELL